MLTRLRIKNFKAWSDTGDIPLAPITVFFGNNSSGKSSLDQLLLLLKQTAESPDRKRVIHPGDRRSLVDVGTFQDMIYEHDTNNHLEAELQWVLPDQLSIENSRTGDTHLGREMRFSTVIREREGRTSSPTVESFSYTLLNPDSTDVAFGMERRQESPNKYDLTTHHYRAVRTGGRAWPLPEPIRFYGFPDEALAYYENTGFLPDFTLELERLLGRIFYLGPLRERPARTYIWSGEIPEHVGWDGERTVEAILAAQGREISRGYKKYYYPFEDVIARWLRQLSLIDSFEVGQIAPQRKEYEVRVQTGPRGPIVKLPDVGFGVSQVLPVIVQCFYAPHDSTIILEQPEIHLHPSVQARLADLFVEAVSSKEDGRNRNVQLIIESHSEHFLRRLQRLIAEERIPADSVAAYFCEFGRKKASIRKLDIDLFGRIENWPDDFFGDIGTEVQMQTQAMIKRIRQEEDSN